MNLRTVLLAFVLASAVAASLVFGRIAVTGHFTFFFLGWNLFLAWLPLLLALAMRAVHRRGRHGAWLVLLGLPWLLLLPNAPYLVTDLIHLRPRHDVPLWFDAVLIMTYAALGLALGLVSLVLVHRVTADRLGPVAGWLLAVIVLPLSVIGVHLGRVHRFNSWDVLTDPSPLLGVLWVRLTDPLGDPRLVLVGIAGTAGLLLAYAATWGLTRALTRGRAHA